MQTALSETFHNRSSKTVLFLVCVIFVVDCFLPQGVDGAAFYVPLLLFTAFIPNKSAPLLIAGVSSLLLLAAPWFKPDGVAVNYVIINRMVMLATIWAAFFFVRLIQQSNERYEAVWRQNSTGLILVDQHGEIVQTSPAIHQFFGYSKDELQGQPIEVLIPHRMHQRHEQHRRHFHANPHPRAMGAGLDLYAVRKDGSEFPVEISLSPFRSEAGDYVIVFVIDNTLRKNQENILIGQKKALETLTQALQTSNKELENFAYISSHDLQEPLRKIRAFSDLLEGAESGSLTSEGKDYLLRIQQSAARMQRLIRDLLEFSRISTRAQPFELLRLNEVVADVLTDLELAVLDAGATIEVDDLPEIEADVTQMRQLFQNLVGNALKFRREGIAPVIKITSQPSEKGDDWADIRVQDNGIGFDEKYTDRIFTIFQRLEGRKYEGSGIGLAICQKIVQRHSGHISVKSSPGQGTTFTLNIPVKNSI